MNDHVLDKDGVKNIWSKLWKMFKSIIGQVDMSKGTLQEQISNKLESNENEVTEAFNKVFPDITLYEED